MTNGTLTTSPDQLPLSTISRVSLEGLKNLRKNISLDANQTTGATTSITESNFDSLSSSQQTILDNLKNRPVSTESIVSNQELGQAESTSPQTGFIPVSNKTLNPPDPFVYNPNQDFGNPNQVLDDPFVSNGSDEFIKALGISGKGTLNQNMASLPEPVAPLISTPVTQPQSPFQYIPANNQQNILQNNQPAFPIQQPANNIVPTNNQLRRPVTETTVAQKVAMAEVKNPEAVTPTSEITVEKAIKESGNSASKLQDQLNLIRMKNRR